MEQEIIELYEHKRWKTRLWFTIALGVCMVPAALNMWDSESPRPSLYSLLMSLGILVVIFAAAKRRDKIEKGIRKDPALDRALNNEMYLANNARATSNGFKAVMWASGAIFFLWVPVAGLVADPPLKLVALFFMTVGFLTYQISWLVYNK